MGKGQLPQGLENRDCHGVTEVQAPGLRTHGDADALVIVLLQKGPVKGKLQLGSAWWFNDHYEGMRSQLKSLMALGCLGNFVGMLTDSRSFLSYTRHEYFRRILCDYLGGLIERGEYPNDFGTSIGKMADDMDVSGWYAPAMNIHRSAFAGRNFEYYSEDGVLSGRMASNAILGAQEHGVYADADADPDSAGMQY